MMVEQHPAWLIGVADRGYLLEVGRVTGEGDIEAIVKNARVADMAPLGAIFVVRTPE